MTAFCLMGQEALNLCGLQAAGTNIGFSQNPWFKLDVAVGQLGDFSLVI